MALNYSNYNIAIFRFIALAITYFLATYTLFLFESIYQTSTLWLPTGIALAGCLIWQYRFIPVIFIGSFVFSIASQQANLNNTETFSILCGLSTGFIFSLQSWGTYRLMSYFSVDITKAPNLSKVIKFIVIALTCCFLGSLANNSLMNEFVPQWQQQSNWSKIITLWLGDFLSVITVTPILLVLFCSSKQNVQTVAQSKVVALPLVILLLILTVIQKYTNDFIQNKIAREIQVRSELIEKSLNRQLYNYVNSISSLTIQLSGNTSITQEEFRKIALPLIARNQGLRALSWNPIIESNEIVEFEKSVNEQSSSAFKVKGKPLQEQDPLVVVKWIEPFNSNEKAFGFNVFSNAKRREAMIISQNSNSPVSTETIQLVQLDNKEAGFLIFIPINKGPSLNNEFLTRNLRLEGFAVGVFVVSDIVKMGVNHINSDLMHIKIYDEMDNNKIIYRYSPSLDDSVSEKQFEFTFMQTVAGRLWKVELSVCNDMFEKLRVKELADFTVYETLIVSLLVLLILTLSSNKHMLLSLVQQRTDSLEKSKNELEQFAFNDPLTNLSNRRMFIRQAKHAISVADRGGYEVALLFLDLNDFKFVNDKLGHDAGDKLLIAVADSFSESLRNCDIIARYGGDEFAILLTNLKQKEDAVTIAKKLISTLNTPFDINNEPLVASISIGIAAYPENGKSVEELIRNADTAMYDAKRQGKGYCCYSEL